MSNENQYFPHDYNARNDVKIIKLLRAKGLAGLGLYWCIVETLYQNGGKMKIEECESIAFALHLHFEDVSEVITEFDLFSNDGTNFWSESIFRRLEKRKDVSEKRKKAAEARWIGQIPMQMQCKCNANAMQNNANDEFAMQVDANIKYKDNIIIDIGGINARTCEEEYINDMLNNQSWLESMAMRFKLPIAEIIKKIQEFELDLQCTATTHNNDGDAKKHFNNWLRIQLQQQTKQNNGKSKNKPQQFTDEQLLDAIAQGWERGERELQRQQVSGATNP